MTLSAAIARFREIDEATTSGSVGKTIGGGAPFKSATDTSNVGIFTTAGNPFYGRRGLAQIEKDRKRRLRTSNRKCKRYDPKCRDKEWEVPAMTGGVTLLRRAKLGER